MKSLNFGVLSLKESTPLHLASRGGHIDSVKCLLAAGALTTALDSLGRDPSAVASTPLVKDAITQAAAKANKVR
jgi:ankyrin repeat protein